ncbi:hypothetical protein H0H81_012663 [Sphagnurus paluster]|uniref:STAS domain-containing protein n=1 Tax=Sphagnurus paluster TaxID=117069 RepID=A0A9P7K850_9AGAR|nr:hypothetical protein H0H81_012663 [Sphagnurus paluster]
MSGTQRLQQLGQPLNTVSSSSSFMEVDTQNGERTALLDHAREPSHERYGSLSGSISPSPEPNTKIDNSALSKKIKYYIPSLAWIPSYSTSLYAIQLSLFTPLLTINRLGGDILAGITVASMLIPQSVSYATSLAKLSPLTGLFSASIPGIVYAFLGTSRQLNVAPEAALSLLLGQAVTEIRHDTPGDEGIEQLIPMFGLAALQRIVQPETTLDKLVFLFENAFTKNNAYATVISFTALATLLVLRQIKGYFKKYWWIYRMPEVLIVVVASTYMCSKLRWDKEGVDILGAVPITTGESFIQFPIRAANLKYLRRTTSTAVLISIVGFLDSIVAAKQNSARFGYGISPNRELVALGAANLVGSFIPGTLPAYGSITRSRINGDVGGQTPHDVIYYWRMGAWVDMSLMSLTFFFSIVWNVEVGVVVSLIISLLLVVHRSSKARMTILGRIPGTDRWKPVNENPEAEESVEGALIVRIRENLDFANTAQLKERLRRLELYGAKKSHPSEDPRRQQASVLVFHLADVESIDASAAQIFFELLEEYKNRGVGLFITHLAPSPRETFSKAGIVDLLGADTFRENVADAIALIERSR